MKNQYRLRVVAVAVLFTILFHFHAGRSVSAAVAEKDFINSIGMKFVSIPAGEFMMGSREDAVSVMKNPTKVEALERDKPLHKVTLSRPFFLQSTEVTVDQFRRFITATGYRTDAEKEGWSWVYDRVQHNWVKTLFVNWRSPGFSQGDNHPVTSVSWNDAQAFVTWLNEKEGTDAYRLPTEAQWEYAARAGTETPFYWGSTPDGRYANFIDTSYANVRPKDKDLSGGVYDGYIFTAPVGSFKPNTWGLYDMSGNVWEWCHDWYGDYPAGAVVDPLGPGEGKRRIVRGGSWDCQAKFMRSSARIRRVPVNRYHDFGFRVARTN